MVRVYVMRVQRERTDDSDWDSGLDVIRDHLIRLLVGYHLVLLLLDDGDRDVAGEGLDVNDGFVEPTRPAEARATADGGVDRPVKARARRPAWRRVHGSQRSDQQQQAAPQPLLSQLTATPSDLLPSDFDCPCALRSLSACDF